MQSFIPALRKLFAYIPKNGKDINLSGKNGLVIKITFISSIFKMSSVDRATALEDIKSVSCKTVEPLSETFQVAFKELQISWLKIRTGIVKQQRSCSFQYF